MRLKCEKCSDRVPRDPVIAGWVTRHAEKDLISQELREKTGSSVQACLFRTPAPNTGLVVVGVFFTTRRRRRSDPWGSAEGFAVRSAEVGEESGTTFLVVTHTPTGPEVGCLAWWPWGDAASVEWVMKIETGIYYIES